MRTLLACQLPAAHDCGCAKTKTSGLRRSFHARLSRLAVRWKNEEMRCEVLAMSHHWRHFFSNHHFTLISAQMPRANLQTQVHTANPGVSPSWQVRSKDAQTSIMRNHRCALNPKLPGAHDVQAKQMSDDDPSWWVFGGSAGGVCCIDHATNQIVQG